MKHSKKGMAMGGMTMAMAPKAMPKAPMKKTMPKAIPNKQVSKPPMSKPGPSKMLGVIGAGLGKALGGFAAGGMTKGYAEGGVAPTPKVGGRPMGQPPARPMRPAEDPARAAQMAQAKASMDKSKADLAAYRAKRAASPQKKFGTGTAGQPRINPMTKGLLQSQNAAAQKKMARTGVGMPTGKPMSGMTKEEYFKKYPGGEGPGTGPKLVSKPLGDIGMGGARGAPKMIMDKGMKNPGLDDSGMGASRNQNDNPLVKPVRALSAASMMAKGGMAKKGKK